MWHHNKFWWHSSASSKRYLPCNFLFQWQGWLLSFFYFSNLLGGSIQLICCYVDLENMISLNYYKEKFYCTCTFSYYQLRFPYLNHTTPYIKNQREETKLNFDIIPVPVYTTKPFFDVNFWNGNKLSLHLARVSHKKRNNIFLLSLNQYAWCFT